jgi:hypothetical protein
MGCEFPDPKLCKFANNFWASGKTYHLMYVNDVALQANLEQAESYYFLGVRTE